MPTVTELLKSANITDEVIASLPKEVASAFETHLATADNNLRTATEKEAAATEAFRLVGLEKAEVKEYVEKHGSNLTALANTNAENKALRAYLEGLKEQGFNIEIPKSGAAEPAKGANPVTFDPTAFSNQVGTVMAEVFNANNEYQRLYGQPFPDDLNAVAAEAKLARKAPYQFIAEKYKFAEKREEQATAKTKEREDSIRKEEREKVEREQAERYGSNPNLRAGEMSRNSLVPKIKSDEFQKASGNMPTKQRQSRLLDNLHKDLAAQKSA